METEYFTRELQMCPRWEFLKQNTQDLGFKWKEDRSTEEASTFRSCNSFKTYNNPTLWLAPISFLDWGYCTTQPVEEKWIK